MSKTEPIRIKRKDLLDKIKSSPLAQRKYEGIRGKIMDDIRANERLFLKYRPIVLNARSYQIRSDQPRYF